MVDSPFTAEYFEKYCELAPYHPRFERNYYAVLEALEGASYNKIITEEQYNQYKKEIRRKFAHKGANSFVVAHTWLLNNENAIRLVRQDEVAFVDVLHVREACLRFKEWAKGHRNIYDHPILLHHIQTISTKLLDLYEARDDNFWEYYKQLRLILPTSISRGRVNRKTVEPYSKVYLAFLQLEIEEFKKADSEYKKTDTFRMDLFTSSRSQTEVEDLFDYYELTYKMAEAFFENHSTFIELHQRFLVAIQTKLAKGEISADSYNYNIQRLKSCSEMYHTANRPDPWDPISLNFHGWKYLSLEGLAYSYSSDHIVTALKYTDRFLYYANAPYLLKNLVNDIVLDTAAMEIKDPEVLDSRYEVVIHNLDLLRNGSLITLDEYTARKGDAYVKIYGK